jgi:hypothetical protein
MAHETNAGDWVVERSQVGDTLIVRTVSGSVWGQPMQFVEELSIGVLDGPDELMFGRVHTITVDRDQGIYVFDGQVPALRYFDSTGQFVKTIGAEGSGPGEYRDMLLGLDVRSDGRVIVRDPRNARLSLYSSDGDPLESWVVASGLYANQAMALDDSDHVYLKILSGPIEPNRPWPMAVLHLDTSGEVVDTVSPPPMDGEPTTGGGLFSPQKVWGISRRGSMIVGVSSQYSFDVHTRGGQVVRIERTRQSVSLTPEERDEHEARREWQNRRQGQFMTSALPPTPDVKPAYRDLSFGRDGRIWVRLHTAAVKADAELESIGDDQPPPLTWREPLVFDVFEEDGTYLGEVRTPRRTSFYVFDGDHAWGIRTGEMGEQYVVRCRLEPVVEGEP